ncbi:hypothetical protein ScPMuIL_001298 [Solemya velum]
MPGQFRSNVWDPLLIIAQIISLQCQFYITLGAWVYILDLIGRFDLSLEQMFTQVDIGFYEDSGRTNLIAFALNSLTSSFGLWVIVRRTRQCLDFAATTHVIHFIVCWIYTGHIPHTLAWWVTNIVCVTLMTVLGEYLCMKSEMKAIPIIGQKVDL